MGDDDIVCANGKPLEVRNKLSHDNKKYSIFNLNNFYYTDRGTIECRISTPTFNASKVVALLLINMLIISNAVEGIYFLTIEDLVNASIKESSLKNWMLDYIAYRQSTLSKWSQSGSSVIYYETFENDDDIGTTGRPLL